MSEQREIELGLLSAARTDRRVLAELVEMLEGYRFSDGCLEWVWGKFRACASNDERPTLESLRGMQAAEQPDAQPLLLEAIAEVWATPPRQAWRTDCATLLRLAEGDRLAQSMQRATKALLRRDFETASEILARATALGTSDVDERPGWPSLGEEAFYGLPGDIVRTLLPQTEGDPSAILVQTLVVAGNVIGRGPFYKVEGDAHRSNLFAVLVGDTSKGRKGTAFGRVKELFALAEERWVKEHIESGLSTGEGLIHHVRDPIEKEGKNADGEPTTTIIDPGVEDKRLLVVETEFARTLKVLTREGSTLSDVIRLAWDGNDLRVMIRTTRLHATDAHISIIGHISRDELASRMSDLDVAGGFANRFLYVLVRRSKYLPDGGSVPDSELKALAGRLRTAIERASSVSRMLRTEAAREMWHALYPELSAGHPGLVGAATGRAEAQTLRLSMLYALLDGRAKIDEVHLRAAHAVWKYVDASAKFIFGGRRASNPIAARVLDALRASPDGLDKTDLWAVLSRHGTREQMSDAISRLEATGEVRREIRPTGGRPRTMFFASCTHSTSSASFALFAPQDGTRVVEAAPVSANPDDTPAANKAKKAEKDSSSSERHCRSAAMLEKMAADREAARAAYAADHGVGAPESETAAKPQPLLKASHTQPHTRSLSPTQRLWERADSDTTPLSTKRAK